MSVASHPIPEIVDWHCEIAVQALYGISRQTAAAAWFLESGDRQRAVECYRRSINLIREFLADDMRVIRNSLPQVVEAMGVA